VTDLPNDRPCADPGVAVVHYLFDQFQIDATWSVRHERGFTWWGYVLAQRIWATPTYDRDGVPTSHIHIETDILRGVESSSRLLARFAALNALATLSACVLREGRVFLHASVSATENNLPFARELAMHAMALQLEDAYQHAKALDPSFRTLDISGHPTSGSRPEPDEMLQVSHVYRREPRTGSAFDQIDFESLVKADGACWLLASAGPTVFTAEFALEGSERAALRRLDGKRLLLTAIFQACSDKPHPRLGDGVLTTMRLSDPRHDEPAVANQLNVAETVSADCHQLGSWSVREDRRLTFVSFFPALVFTSHPEYAYRLFESLVWHASSRALWAHTLLTEGGA
jgi:hypothetical protein